MFERLSNQLYTIGSGIRIAVDAMIANKVRAGLTILGVAVGVFVVVIMSAAVHGINESVAKDFEKTGPTTFFVMRYPITFENCDGSGDTCHWRSNPQITFPEQQALQALPSIEQAGVNMGWNAQVRVRDQIISSAQIVGVLANWPQISAPDMVDGRAFTESEVRAAARVIVINANAKDRLFGENDAIGREVMINGSPFSVIGVYKDVTSFLTGGDHPKIILPVYSMERHLNVRLRYMGLIIKPGPNVSQDQAMDDVIATLRGMRGLRPGRESNFAVITQDKLLDVYNKIFGMFFLVMISLSAVGLLVGGVGVVAIMMISVTERTREIGVRKALGATRMTILWQFLIEAVTLTGTGAMIGLAVGWVAAVLIRHYTPVSASVPPMAVLASLGASAFTGVLFGMLPAIRASRLDPVAALRYE
jgi:putative ABC transport system permease protein